MRIIRNLVPYRLLAMHPVLHVTMLLSGLVMIGLNDDFLTSV